MKKMFFLIMLMAFAFSLGACTSEKPLSFDQIPQNAQNVITKYFSKEDILLIKLDKEGLMTEYEVKLKDGTELSFDRKGNLTKIDCQLQKVPDGLVPENVLAYVNSNHPDTFITEWSKDDLRWKAELNNSLKLVFNNGGKFIRYDD